MSKAGGSTRGWEGDCGVCGVPATQWNEVCEGYSVPRCYPHGAADKYPAYQAESRLSQANKRIEEVEKERDEARVENMRLRDRLDHFVPEAKRWLKQAGEQKARANAAESRVEELTRGRKTALHWLDKAVDEATNGATANNQLIDEWILSARAALQGEQEGKE